MAAFITIDDFNRTKLRDELILQSYTVVEETTDRLVMRSSDTTWMLGIERVNFSDSPFDAQTEAWLFNVFTSYDNQVDFYLQQDGITNLNNHSTNRYYPSLPVNRSMRAKAFMSVTNHRIILTVRFGNQYYSYYIGKMNSFDSGANYPQPLILSGPSGYGLTHYNPIYNSSDINNMGNIAGVNGSSWVKSFDGTWNQIHSESGNATSPNNYFAIYPFLYGTINATKNIDGTTMLFPSIVIGGTTVGNYWFYGELDIYRVAGFESTAESTFTIGADTFITFPVGGDSVVSDGEFFAYKI